MLTKITDMIIGFGAFILAILMVLFVIVIIAFVYLLIVFSYVAVPIIFIIAFIVAITASVYHEIKERFYGKKKND